MAALPLLNPERPQLGSADEALALLRQKQQMQAATGGVPQVRRAVTL
jgi:hypothetical protein